MSDAEIKMIVDWLKRVDGQVAGAREDIAGLRAILSSRPCPDHDMRLRALERGYWQAVGIVGCMAATPGVIALIKILLGGTPS